MGESFRRVGGHGPVQARAHAQTLKGPLDGQEQTLLVHRLDQIVVSPEAHGLDRLIHVVQGRDDDEFGVGILGFGLLQHGQAVHAGHEQVQQDHVHPRVLQPLHGLLAAGAEHAVAQTASTQETLHGAPHNRLVVHHHYVHAETPRFLRRLKATPLRLA
jgi:hypothetical protein